MTTDPCPAAIETTTHPGAPRTWLCGDATHHHPTGATITPGRPDPGQFPIDLATAASPDVTAYAVQLLREARWTAMADHVDTLATGVRRLTTDVHDHDRKITMPTDHDPQCRDRDAAVQAFAEREHLAREAERLEADVRRLTTERDAEAETARSWRDIAAQNADQCDRARTELADARAERNRYRDALHAVARPDPGTEPVLYARHLIREIEEYRKDDEPDRQPPEEPTDP